MNHIYVIFLPGAAGNLLCNALEIPERVSYANLGLTVNNFGGSPIWHDFEKRIKKLNNTFIPVHPDYKLKNDQCILIDSTNYDKWRNLNAVYKGSKTHDSYITAYNKIDRSNCITVDLSDFMQLDTFLKMYGRLTNELNVPINDINEVTRLYNEWYDVSLMHPAQLDEFEKILERDHSHLMNF